MKNSNVNMKVDWLNVAQKCFDTSGKKQLHVNEMAKIATEKNFLSASIETDEIAKRFSASLARNVKGTNSLFKKVKNSKGGYKKGIYITKEFRPIQMTQHKHISVSTNYTGKAGEFAVLSELLFRGYNSAVMTVDEGLDVVASKNNKYFHIQVKTANGDDSKPYATHIRKEAFQFSSETFYIILLRRPQKIRCVNDYIILSSGTIRTLIAGRILNDGPTISLKITVNNNRFYLNGTHEITHHVNDFDCIS